MDANMQIKWKKNKQTRKCQLENGLTFRIVLRTGFAEAFDVDHLRRYVSFLQ